MGLYFLSRLVKGIVSLLIDKYRAVKKILKAAVGLLKKKPKKEAVNLQSDSDWRAIAEDLKKAEGLVRNYPKLREPNQKFGLQLFKLAPALRENASPHPTRQRAFTV